MATKKQSEFMNSEKCAKIRQTLMEMVSDTAFNTDATYSTNSTSYPSNMIPFVDKHLQYLSEHQDVNPDDYLSNLRLKTRLKIMK